MTIISRPPVLRVRHDFFQIRLDSIDIERFDCFLVIKVTVVRIRFGIMLAQNIQIEIVRPPIFVICPGNRGCLAAMHERAFALVVHRYLPVIGWAYRQSR